MSTSRPPALGAIFGVTRQPIEFDNYADDVRVYPAGTEVQIATTPYPDIWQIWPVDDEHEDDPLSAVVHYSKVE